MKQNTISHIRRRWILIALYSFSAMLICTLLRTPLDSVSKLLANSLVHWAYPIQLAIIILMIAIIGTILTSLGGYRYHDMFTLTSWRYPPVWLSGIFGSILYFLVQFQFSVMATYTIDFLPAGNVPSVGAADVLTFLIGISLIPVTHFLQFHPLSKPDENTSIGAIQQKNPLKSIDTMLEWLQNERPIRTPNDDGFGSSRIAENIAARLLDASFNSVALLGAFGSGKSSVLELVRHYLSVMRTTTKSSVHENEPRLRLDSTKIVPEIVTLSIWGIEGESIDRFILRAIIRQLSTKIDAVSFCRIPSNYETAIRGGGPDWFRALFDIVVPQANASELLARIDNALETAGIRLVVFIEDIERNRDTDATLDQISALLDRLKDLENISFVLACGLEDHASTALARICETRRSIAPLPLQDVVSAISMLRNNLLNLYENDIDTLESETRARRIGLHNSYSIVHEMMGKRSWPIYDVAAILNTPRAIKNVMRQVKYKFALLHGEVDFDDLLVVCTLEWGIFPAFQFLASNIKQLRRFPAWHLESDSSISAQDSLNNGRDDGYLLTQFRKMLEAELPEHQDAARKLIIFLIGDKEVVHRSLAIAPQGVRNATPTDYFRRILDEILLEGEVRDQDYLSSIIDCTGKTLQSKSADKHLAQNMLLKPRWAEKVDQFGFGLLDGKQVRSLSSELFALIAAGFGRREDRHGIEEEGDYPGIRQLWRLAGRRMEPGHVIWIRAEFRRAIDADSLTLVIELVKFWTTDGSAGTYYFLTSDQREKLRLQILEDLEGAYSKNPDRLSLALRKSNDNPYTLWRLSHYLRSQSSADNISTELHMSWLVPAGIKSCLSNPHEVLPEIACFFVRTHLNTDENEWFSEFDKSMNREILDDVVQELRPIISDMTFDTSAYAPQTRSTITWFLSHVCSHSSDS